MVRSTDTFLVGAILLCLGTTAQAGPIMVGGETYLRSGNSETGITATFGGGPIDTAPKANTSTALTYSGLVEFTVSGVGESSSSALNDAFYVYTDTTGNPVAPTHNSSFYQLAIDTATIQGSPGSPTPVGQLAKQSIVYDIDAGAEVTPTYVPAYQASHVYRFVIDTTLTSGWTGVASALNFTVANGIYSDNSGNYTIDVYQLAKVEVSEPGTLGLLGLGLLGVALAHRKRA